MSYSSADRASGSHVAAVALLAVSAGACFGAALSQTSMYSAPTAIRPAVTSRPATYTSRAETRAPVMQAAPQWTGAPDEALQTAAAPQVSTWTLASGGLCAAAATAAALIYKKKSQSSENVAMLAVFGRKPAPKPAAKAAVKSVDRPLWYPTAEAPEWLDGSLPGDRGFDPLGLAKPTEFIQFDLDQLDQNAPKNFAGAPIGRVVPKADEVSTDALQPYSEVFGLQRFRECELLHGRWAMLAVLGCLVSEAATGVAWQNVGLVQAQQGASYLGSSLPFTGSQLVWIEVLSMGFVEVFRNTELDLDKRCYPGGAFDPLKLTDKDEETTFRLKEAELKHGRLAMIAFLGFAIAAGKTGLGATQAFNAFAGGFS